MLNESDVISLREELPRLSRFFRAHFYAEWLDDPSDLAEAIKDYLGASGGDRDGQLLRGEARALLAKQFSEVELVRLIEDGWRTQVEAADVGFRYVDVLQELDSILQLRPRS